MLLSKLLISGVNMRFGLDTVVGEINMLMEELEKNINFYDSGSTGFSSNMLVQNFDEAKKIEVFIAYMTKYKSSLFRGIRQMDGSIVFSNTMLSSFFNPYNFLCFGDNWEPEQYLSNFTRFGLSLQLFVILLFQQNKNSNLRTFPRENVFVDANGIGSISADERFLPTDFKKNVNYFVENFRAHFNAPDFQKKIKAQLKKTNSKFNDYCKYIDELFDKNGDLTFVTLELALLTGTGMNFQDKIMNLVELKTKFLNNARNVDPLSRSVGYVGKWEWSAIKYGLYFRIIFIFPTDKIGDIKALQHDLNFYWCEMITEGQGLCHHAHIAAATSKFKKSFCNIKSSNMKERDIFKKRAIGYITKSEKYYCPTELITTLSQLMVDKSPDRAPSLTFRSKSK